MRMTVAPFERSRHLDAAALLLADRHRRDRERDPRLPAAFEVPAACRPLIEQALEGPGAAGVVARRGDEVLGFAVMSTFLPAPTHMTAGFFPPRTAQLGYAAHAATQGHEHDAYRSMYAMLADHFVASGYFEHYAYVAPRDAAVNDVFASLGFGRALTCAVRDAAVPVEGGPADGVQLHMAAAEDGAVVAALNKELSLHHSRSPIFWPYLHETVASSTEFQAELLADPDANAHWIAYRDGKPLGMNTFMQPVWLAPMVTPERTVYLYQGVVSGEARAGGVGTAILAQGIAWARERGYDHVALHFASANIEGARFWLGNHFEPVEHRLARHIDERIAWAN
jgi:GNAT superfamily N-acetyltransferase